MTAPFSKVGKRKAPNLPAQKEAREREEARLSCARPEDATGKPIEPDPPRPRVLFPHGDRW